MSKDDTGCKLAPVYKHKERKPKKPHYIPRPWGKPYNYKCFQCPFTCMEKSHLYNHMKYSLCKNSLSLLIESDWSYKKGNLLHPELRFLQAAEASRARGRQGEPEAGDAAAAAAGLRRGVDREGAADGPAGADGAGKAGDEAHQFQDEEEDDDDEETSGLFPETDTGEKKEETKEADSAAGEPREVDVNALLLRFKSKRDQPCKDPTPDFIITDVFSLKKHVVKGKEPPEPEPEPKPKPCRGPKRCPGNGALLMEQWKLVANGQRRAAAGEVPSPCPGGNIIPCYPPPAYGEFHEPQSLNLSLLGINYPLSPNLFSYLGPSVAGSAAPQPHLAQLPFLASTAQLMHPHAAHFQPLQSPERQNLLPRFYYPLLFEHSFGAAENKMAAGKPEAPQLQPPQQPPAAAGLVHSQAKTPPDPAHKPGLLKVPVLKAGLPWAKGFHEELPPEQGRGAPLRPEKGDKWPSGGEKEAGSALHGLCKKPAVAGAYHQLVGGKDGAPLAPSSLGKAGVPASACSDGGPHALHDLKRRFPGGGLDFVGSGALSPRKAKCQASHLRPPPTQPPRALDHWHVELHACSPEDPQKANCSDAVSPVTPDPSRPFPKPSQEQTPPLGPRGPEATTTVLIEDLSKTLEEYQAVEKKLSDLAKEDSPAQKQLRGQLVKIRQELFHIHEALEKATRATEGPLDLSVKKATRGPLEEGYQELKEPKVAPPSKCGKALGKDAESVRRCSAAGEGESHGEEAPGCLLESENNKTIDLLIKMSRSEGLRAACAEAQLGAVIKAEVLPLGVPLELRHAMEPYYSRTTKCEADSSVLLGADGRPHPAQGPSLPSPEDLPLGPRGALPRPLLCGPPGGEREGVCLHSPLSTDPRLAESP